MTTWNLFDPAVSEMRTRLANVWKRLGKFAGCPSKSTSYKQQALVELARRLECEAEIARYKALGEAVDNLLDERGELGQAKAFDALAKARAGCDKREEQSAMAHETATIYFPDGAFDPRVGWDYVSWHRDEEGKLFCVAYSRDQVKAQVEKHVFFSPFIPLYTTALVNGGLDDGYYSRP